MSYKCGTVAILGKPNAGKSTLFNALIGQKISIVSPKAQTTRNNIIGAITTENYQILFTDTPGQNRFVDALGKNMSSEITNAKSDVDVLLVLVDGSKKFTDETYKYIESFSSFEQPVILVVTKTDLTSFEKLYPILSRLNELKFLKEIIPVSSFKKKNLEVLISSILDCFETTDKENRLVDEDFLTDKSINFLVGEIIREKALLLLNEEIPHGIGIIINSFKEKQSITLIDADIIVDRQSHKAIVLGHRGEKIKDIGTRARIDIEKLLDTKVNLTLFVKVIENWKNKIDVVNSTTNK